MITTTPFKSSKKNKITPKIFWSMLSNPRISRVLILLEAFPALTKADIFSLLNCPKDRGVSKALEELKKIDLIEEKKIAGFPFRCSTNQNKPEIIKGTIQSVGKRFCLKNKPIVFFFENIKTKKQKQLKEKITQEIQAMFSSYLSELQLNPFKTSEDVEDDWKPAMNDLLTAKKEVEGKQNKRGMETINEIISKYVEIKKDLMHRAQGERQKFIFMLREKKFSYADYILFALQRILISELKLRYSGKQKYSNREVEKIKEIICTIAPMLETLANDILSIIKITSVK